jgi:transposase
MRPYSNDLRRALLAAYDTHDYSQRAVAELCGVSPAPVRHIVRRQRATGTPHALPRGGGRPRTRTQPVHDRGRQLLVRRHDMTLTELCEPMTQEYNTRVSASTMGRLLQHLGLPRKKRRSMPQNAILHASNKRA